MPPLPGADATHVFKLWTVPDMDRLDGFIEASKPRHAVVVGGGFIGLEMAEAFHQRGLETTVVELLPTVMAVMDREFGAQVAGELAAHGVQVITGAGVKAVLADKTVELTDGRKLAADLVLFSVGVRPELTLAKRGRPDARPGRRPAGRRPAADLGSGHLRRRRHGGDRPPGLGQEDPIPLAGPANRQGRIAASNALGQSDALRRRPRHQRGEGLRGHRGRRPA